MDFHLPDYAERFVTAGFSVLIFDYRYLGESEGQPRQLINIHKQREDIRNAILFLKKHESINREKIVLWGTSLGGGHVIEVAANDPTIAAVIAQIPGIDMVNPKAKAIIKIPAGMVLKILLSAIWDGIVGLFGFKPYYIKVFSDTGETAVFTQKELKPRFEVLMKSGSTWQNRFTPRFYLSPPRYKKGTAEKIKMPLLVCIADKEIFANPSFQAWVGQQAPKGEVKHYDAGHFDFYHGDTFEKVVKDQIDFIRTHIE
jgi:alpha/beta superfamily hydrolase